MYIFVSEEGSAVQQSQSPCILFVVFNLEISFPDNIFIIYKYNQIN